MSPKEIFKRWKEIPELKETYEKVKQDYSHLPDNKADCMARGAVLNFFHMRSMAKVIGKIRPDYRGDFRELLGWAAEFVEDVDHGKHYIFRDGSRWLFNAPPTDAENNSLVNISLDTLVKLRQIEAEHEQLIELCRAHWPDSEYYISLAQTLAE